MYTTNICLNFAREGLANRDRSEIKLTLQASP